MLTFKNIIIFAFFYQMVFSIQYQKYCLDENDIFNSVYVHNVKVSSLEWLSVDIDDSASLIAMIDYYSPYVRINNVSITGLPYGKYLISNNFNYTINNFNASYIELYLLDKYHYRINPALNHLNEYELKEIVKPDVVYLYENTFYPSVKNNTPNFLIVNIISGFVVLTLYMFGLCILFMF
jgi:hypothetical protein